MTADPRAPGFDGTQPCRANPDLFFPHVGGTGPAVRQAKAICWGCPFREPCLAYALTASDRYGRPLDGVWGGTTKSQRAWLRTHPDATIKPPKEKPQGRPREPIAHGTDGGYRAHLRRHIPIPDGDLCGCRAAHSSRTNEYQISARRRRRTAQPRQGAH